MMIWYYAILQLFDSMHECTLYRNNITFVDTTIIITGQNTTGGLYLHLLDSIYEYITELKYSVQTTGPALKSKLSEKNTSWPYVFQINLKKFHKW